MSNVEIKKDILKSTLLKALEVPVYNIEVFIEHLFNNVSSGKRKNDFVQYMFVTVFAKNGVPVASARNRRDLRVSVDFPRLSWIFSLQDMDSFKNEIKNYISENVFISISDPSRYIRGADSIYVKNVITEPDTSRRFGVITRPYVEEYTTIDYYTSAPGASPPKHPSLPVRCACFLARAAKDGVVQICSKCVFPLYASHSLTGYHDTGVVQAPVFLHPVIFAASLSRRKEPRILFMAEEGKLGLCGGKRSNPSQSRDIELSHIYHYLLNRKLQDRGSRIMYSSEEYVDFMKKIGWRELGIGLYKAVEAAKDDMT